MITAANPRPLRALTDGNFFDNADQIVVLVVETRRVVARPWDRGLLTDRRQFSIKCLIKIFRRESEICVSLWEVRGKRLCLELLVEMGRWTAL